VFFVHFVVSNIPLLSYKAHHEGNQLTTKDTKVAKVAKLKKLKTTNPILLRVLRALRG